MLNFDMNTLRNPDLFRKVYAEHGPMVKLTLPGMNIVVLSDVHLAREVLKDNAQKFTNGDTFRKVFGWFFPTSVIVVEGAQWQRIRRIISRAIQGTRISEALRPMHLVAGRAEKLYLAGKMGEPCDVHRLAAQLTFDTFGFWAYDVDFNTMGGDNPKLLESCEAIADVLSSRNDKPFEWLWKLPTAENKAANDGLAFLQAYSSKLLASREESDLGTGPQKDLLAALLAASSAEDDAKNRMSRQEIIDNIGTIFFGAYDTTSATIAFTLHFLAENPASQELLAAELANHDLGSIDKDVLEKLPYLDMVCLEANRMRSTAFGFPRTATTDVEVGGYRIHKGTLILIDHTGLTSRDPELWGGQTDLDNFRPERWSEVKPHKLASLPFGFGARRCPGSQLATMEHKYFTAALVQAYSWRLDAARPLEVSVKVGLCPKNGCWLIPEPRSTQQQAL